MDCNLEGGGGGWGEGGWWNYDEFLDILLLFLYIKLSYLDIVGF